MKTLSLLSLLLLAGGAMVTLAAIGLPGEAEAAPMHCQQIDV